MTPSRRSLLGAVPAATLAASLPAAAQAPAADPSRPVRIRGATVVTMDPSVPDLPVGDILVLVVHTGLSSPWHLALHGVSGLYMAAAAAWVLGTDSGRKGAST